jgi:flagellar biosynthesis/type III secretory pathway M-ring protein FliF/YscJ
MPSDDCQNMDNTGQQERERGTHPATWVTVGLLAAGVGVALVLWLQHQQPDYRARRLIASSERLIEQISTTLDELKQRSDIEVAGQ